MLKDFFQAPEIAAIFATKGANNNGTIAKSECVGCAKLRAGKQSKKREQTRKRTARRARGHHHQNTAMFSARKARTEDAEQIATLYEENVYYDYDYETGTIIKKKHSVFDALNKITKSDKDSSDVEGLQSNLDLDSGDLTEGRIEDLGEVKSNEGYCPSDSAYDTNHDEFTESLERFTIKEDFGDGVDVPLSNDIPYAKRSLRRESPYRRCRSSAICGRNCELCRGKNNNVMPTKQEQGDEEIADSSKLEISERPEQSRNNKKTNSNGKTKTKKHGLFGLKDEKHRENSQRGNSYGVGNEVDNLEDFKGFMTQKYEDTRVKNMSRDEEIIARNSVSSTPPSVNTHEGSTTVRLYEDGYNTSYPTEMKIIPNDVTLSDDLADMYEDTEPFDYEPYDPYANFEYLEQTGHYDEFSCGPHLLMLYDFKAEHEDDISICKGDIVLLLDNRDRDWVWVMTQTNEEGYIPRSLTIAHNDCEECRLEEIHRKQFSLNMKSDPVREKPILDRVDSRKSQGSNSNQPSPRSNQSLSKSNSNQALPSSNLTSPRANQSLQRSIANQVLSNSNSMSPRSNQTMLSEQIVSPSNATTPISNGIHRASADSISSCSSNSPMTDKRMQASDPPLSPTSPETYLTSRMLKQKNRTLNQTIPASSSKHQASIERSDQINQRLNQTFPSSSQIRQMTGPESYSTGRKNQGLNQTSPGWNQIPQERILKSPTTSLKTDIENQRLSQTFPRSNQNSQMSNDRNKQLYQTRSWEGHTSITSNSTKQRLNDTLSEDIQSKQMALNRQNAAKKERTPSKKQTRSSIFEKSALDSDGISLELNNSSMQQANFTASSDLQVEKMKEKSIRLIVLSSFETKERDKLSVMAGDVVYVDIKNQKVPEWLWAYSPRLKTFGFIPESIIDQLRSSSV